MRLWNNAKKCNCLAPDCNIKNHKLCSICEKKLLFGSHFSVKRFNKSIYSWNIDFIIPKSLGGNNKLSNLHVVHIKCNKSKNSKDQSGEY
ncbi:MAG: HNH endonuclease [Mycoplasmoidaceae bacterium]